MPDSEVKIHVQADADASKIKDMEKRILDLRRAADAYDKKSGMQTAATSARAEATGLERELTRLTRERTSVARSAAKEETREMREQFALRKAGVSRIHSAAIVGKDIVQGGDSMSGVTSALMNLGAKFGPIGMLVGTVAAASVGGFAMIAQQNDDFTRRRLGIAEEDANERFRMQRNRGVYGSSGALNQQALGEEEKIAQLNHAIPALEEKARIKWYAPSTWTWGGLRKNEGQKELEDNRQERIAAGLRRQEEIKGSQEKYRNEEGSLELDTLRGRAKRSQTGQREAFVAQMGSEWLSKYKASIAASGDDKMAKEIADLNVQNDVRDRQAQAGAGLVDSRSGGAEMAAAARWGMQSFNTDQVASKIDALHQTVLQSNQTSQLKNQAK